MSVEAYIPNEQFNDWTIVRRASKEEMLAAGIVSNKVYVIAKCSCSDEEHVVLKYHITSGLSKSCGHNKVTEDLADKKIGNWKVIRRASKEDKIAYGKEKMPGTGWVCQCECGVIDLIRADGLKNKRSNICTHDKVKVGKHYGEWEVIRKATEEDIDKYSSILEATCTYWLCRCSCGKYGIQRADALICGHTKSCGHSTTGFKDLVGSKYGHWRVIRRATEEEIYKYGPLCPTKAAYWLCECDCEKKTRRILLGSRLTDDSSSSCGCGVIRNRALDEFRTEEQLRLIKNKELLIQELAAFESNHGRKPSTRDVAVLLGFNQSGNALAYIRSRGLEEYVYIQDAGNSGYEAELLELLNLGEIQYKLNDRSALNGKEIDIYIPDKNIGIEFNGNYWHSSEYKEKRYHINKTIDAQKKGVRLVHIFEYEFTDDRKREIIINMLKDSIHGTDSILAKQCDACVISASDAAAFHEKYNIHGSVYGTWNYGLKYNGELVSLATFRIASLGSDEAFELARYTVKNGLSIVDDLCELIIKFREENTGIIATYCDISKYNGDVYKSVGFEEKHITEPNYIWFNPLDGTLLSRHKCQKSELVRKGWGNVNQTVEQIMKQTGHKKIYDCGSIKYILD